MRKISFESSIVSDIKSFGSVLEAGFWRFFRAIRPVLLPLSLVSLFLSFCPYLYNASVSVSATLALKTTHAIEVYALVLISFLMFLSLFALCVTDILTRRLPTAVVRPLQINMFAFHLVVIACSNAGINYLIKAVAGSVVGCLIAAIVFILPSLILGNDAIGGGDIRLAMGMGLGLGIDVVIVLIAACIMGAIWCLIKKRKNFPLGPFLSVPYSILVINSIFFA